MTYDDNSLRWNGADLLTRVARKSVGEENKTIKRMELNEEPSHIFFPINSQDITRYFLAPATEAEKAHQDVLLEKILPGQERFRTLTSSYYRGAQGIIMDISEVWAKEIDLYSTNQECMKMLVGNKVDKEEDRVVSKKEGIDFAREYGCLFIKSSAKTRINVHQCFEEFVWKILTDTSPYEKKTIENLQQLWAQSFLHMVNNQKVEEQMQMDKEDKDIGKDQMQMDEEVKDIKFLPKQKQKKRVYI